MLNTLYTIAGGIALAVGALGASDDFDGAQLAQNAFFGPDEELEAVEEQVTTTEEVQVVKDVLEWDEIASEALGMTLTGSDELTDDEKLEVAVLTGEIPSDVSENLVEVPQNAENTQSEGLSEEEFYSMLEQQFNDAMEAISSKEEIADSEPLVIEAVAENEPKAEEIAQETTENVTVVETDELASGIKLQPEDDINAEKALEEVVSNSVKEEPWVVLHGLPDIPEDDMNAMTNQPSKNEQPAQPEQTDVDNVDVQDIPVLESIVIDVPEVEESELEEIAQPLFNDIDDADAKAAEAEEVEAEEAEAEEVEAEEAEAEEVEAEEAEAEEVEDEDALIVEPLEADDVETESKDDALLIPSLEIPPAVVTEEQRAKISEEVDAIVNQSNSFDGWIPRQIPVSGSVDDAQPQTKPEDSFIQNFSKQNVKESILENTGIELND